MKEDGQNPKSRQPPGVGLYLEGLKIRIPTVGDFHFTILSLSIFYFENQFQLHSV